MCVSARDWVCQMTWQKYIREYWQCLVQLLVGLPVHDESVGDDHLLQIVLIMSGDTEKVQLVALLIISDLEQDKPSLQLSAKNPQNGWNRQSTKMHLITVKPFSPLAPGNTEPLNHLFIPAHTWLMFWGGVGVHQILIGKLVPPAVYQNRPTVHGAQPHPGKWRSYQK